MTGKKITIKDRQYTLVDKEYSITKMMLVPSWINKDGSCPVCKWGFYETPVPEFITAVELENGNVTFLCNNCANKS